MTGGLNGAVRSGIIGPLLFLTSQRPTACLPDGMQQTSACWEEEAWMAPFIELLDLSC